jgi:hypothetical protein
LFREHYYPLVEKGSYPNHKLGPDKTGVQHYGEWPKDFALNENARDFGNEATTASLSYPPIIPISHSNGQTQIEEKTPHNRAELIWEVVKNNALKIGNSSPGTSLITSEMSVSSKSPASGIIETNAEAKELLGEASVAKPETSNLAETIGKGDKWWIGLGIGAISVGALALGGIALDFFFGKSRRKAKKEAKRKINVPSDEVVVRARW